MLGWVVQRRSRPMTEPFRPFLSGDTKRAWMAAARGGGGPVRHCETCWRRSAEAGVAGRRVVTRAPGWRVSDGRDVGCGVRRGGGRPDSVLTVWTLPDAMRHVGRISPRAPAPTRPTHARGPRDQHQGIGRAGQPAGASPTPASRSLRSRPAATLRDRLPMRSIRINGGAAGDSPPDVSLRSGRKERRARSEPASRSCAKRRARCGQSIFQPRERNP